MSSNCTGLELTNANWKSDFQFSIILNVCDTIQIYLPSRKICDTIHIYLPAKKYVKEGIYMTVGKK